MPNGMARRAAESDCQKRIRAYFKALPSSDSISIAAIKRCIGVTYFAGLDSSSKIVKGKKQGYMSLILYLSPASSSGINVCSEASPGCIAACLNVSGRSLMEHKSGKNSIQLSRLKKTWLSVFRRDLANKLVASEIVKGQARAEKSGMKFAVRLNGTADLDWSHIIKAFPTIQFYDYSKHLNHVYKAKALSNWHITFSYSGTNLLDCLEAVKLGANLALPIAFSSARNGKLSGLIKELVDAGLGYSQDDSDLRFLDPSNNPLGLLAVKQTPGTAEGIKKGFLLDREGFEAIRQAVLGLCACV